MYYRDSTASDTGATIDVPYRKIDVVELEDTSAGYDLTSSITLYNDRSRLPSLMKGELGNSQVSLNSSSTGYGNCGKIEVFAEDALDALLSSTNQTVFNDEKTNTPLCGTGCLTSTGSVNLTCTQTQIDSATTSSRRRLSSISKTKLIVSYTIDGGGVDTIDFVPKQKAPPPSVIVNLPPPSVLLTPPPLIDFSPPPPGVQSPPPPPPPPTVDALKVTVTSDVSFTNVKSGDVPDKYAMGVNIGNVTYASMSGINREDVQCTTLKFYDNGGEVATDNIDLTTPFVGRRRSLLSSHQGPRMVATILVTVANASQAQAASSGLQSSISSGAFLAGLKTLDPTLNSIVGLTTILESIDIVGPPGAPPIPVPVPPSSPPSTPQGPTTFFGGLSLAIPSIFFGGGGDDDDNNTAIIAGVCSAVGALILGIVVFVFLSKKKVSEKESNV